MTLALGLDIGGGRITGVVVDETGTVVRRMDPRASTDPSGPVRELASDFALAAFGIGTDDREAAGTFTESTKLPAARQSAAGSAAVTAEVWIGAARDARHVICLEVGDRVSAGVILEGRLWEGAHGLAGYAAWMALNPVERQDYRKFGSLAAEVSSQGIARRLSWRIQAGDDSDVLTRAGSLESITAAHVFESARAGDGVASSVVRETARYIGMALANFAVSFDPEIVVLSGGVAASHDLLLDPVQQEYTRRLPPAMAGKVRFAMSSLGGDSVAIGAARLAWLERAGLKP